MAKISYNKWSPPRTLSNYASSNSFKMRRRPLSTRPSASKAIRRQQNANLPGEQANQAQRAVSYRGARELNYRPIDEERTAMQRRIDRVTGVTPNGVNPRTEVGYRANRMAQAVRTFASAPQPTGGVITNSSNS